MDQRQKYKIVAFGEVLWDLLPNASLLGGAPFNFTYRINTQGNEGYMISAIGKDELGEKALNTIYNLEISDKYIQINPLHQTGKVNVFFDMSKNPDYEIIKNVAYDFITFNNGLKELIGQADCICFGTLAQRNQISNETLQTLLKNFKGRFRFYDLNLRKDCYSVENIIASLNNTDILKLNKQEAIEINNLLRLDKIGLVNICKELVNKYQLQYCVTTLEELGSLAVSYSGEIVYSPGFEIKLMDPLGSGDAFSAGFVDALLRGKSLKEASESGNLLGALVATQKGATQKIFQPELENIKINCNRITDKDYSKHTGFTYS